MNSYYVKYTNRYAENLTKEIKGNNVLIIIDSNLMNFEIHKKEISRISENENVKLLKVNISEKEKNYKKILQLITEFDKRNLTRNDIIISIGGGVLLDVVAFAASIFKRGIKFINVPTTLLSMVDSSVGSKNGINFNGKKNLLGTFSDPQKVIIDTTFLETLPKKEIKNGFAEVIKCACISDDKKLYNYLLGENIELEFLIKESIDIKFKHVTEDKFDFGKRMNLNFGHTFGHAIESYFKYEKYSHGEAIGIGMLYESDFNKEIIYLLQKFDLPYKIQPENYNIDKMIEIMKSDKKNTSEKITYIYMESIGKVIKRKVTEKEISKILEKRSEKYLAEDISGNYYVNLSKSYLHRYLMVALISKMKYSIKINGMFDISNDVLATIDVLRAYNIKIEIKEKKIKVDSTMISNNNVVIDTKQSGTTFRMIIPIIIQKFGKVIVDADNQMKKRPIDEFEKYYKTSSSWPKTIEGRIDQNVIKVNANISSQYLSGYIFAAALSEKETKIKIESDIYSLNYVLMTIKVLQDIGIKIEFDKNNKEIIVKNNGINISDDNEFEVEMDYSNYAFYATYNKLCEINKKNGYINVINDLDTNSLQSDFLIIDILKNEETEIDLTNSPDLLPILMVYGALNKKGVKLFNTSRIRYKESNRINAMCNSFYEMGIIVNVTENSVEVKAKEKIGSKVINTYDDHRIAMAFIIMSCFIEDGLQLNEVTCINKSFKNFLKENNENIR